jgi:hypothetical protein
MWHFGIFQQQLFLQQLLQPLLQHDEGAPQAAGAAQVGAQAAGAQPAGAAQLGAQAFGQQLLGAAQLGAQAAGAQAAGAAQVGAQPFAQGAAQDGAGAQQVGAGAQQLRWLNSPASAVPATPRNRATHVIHFIPKSPQERV